MYRGDVVKTLLPTTTGMIGIFPGHMNIVTRLVSGTITYLPSDKATSILDSFADHRHTIEVGGGLAMIEDDVITVAAE